MRGDRLVATPAAWQSTSRITEALKGEFREDKIFKNRPFYGKSVSLEIKTE